MSKFKVGDKVRVVMSDEYFGLHKGSVHTVVSVHPMGNIELTGIDVIQWSPDRFELVQEESVLTPEEVIEHLRKGTPMQIKSMRYTPRDVTVQWVDIDEDFTEGLLYDTICSKTFRLKPEPEIIELNGKKYREIVE